MAVQSLVGQTSWAGGQTHFRPKGYQYHIYDKCNTSKLLCFKHLFFFKSSMGIIICSLFLWINLFFKMLVEICLFAILHCQSFFANCRWRSIHLHILAEGHRGNFSFCQNFVVDHYLQFVVCKLLLWICFIANLRCGSLFFAKCWWRSFFCKLLFGMIYLQLWFGIISLQIDIMDPLLEIFVWVIFCKLLRWIIIFLKLLLGIVFCSCFQSFFHSVVGNHPYTNCCWGSFFPFHYLQYDVIDPFVCKFLWRIHIFANCCYGSIRFNSLL